MQKKIISTKEKKIPQDTDCILMLTTFLNHNTMLKYKSEEKKEIYHSSVQKDRYHVCI